MIDWKEIFKNIFLPWLITGLVSTKLLFMLRFLVPSRLLVFVLQSILGQVREFNFMSVQASCTKARRIGRIWPSSCARLPESPQVGNGSYLDRAS